MLKSILQGKPIGHPLHPALNHFPIGLFVFSLLFDLASQYVGQNWLVQAAATTMLLGLFMALLAAGTGLADWSDIRNDHPAKPRANTHMLLNLTASGLYLVNLFLRSGQLNEPQTALLPLLLSIFSMVMIFYSGYLGGTLVYDEGIGPGRHRRHSPTPIETIRRSSQQAREGWVDIIEVNRVQDQETLRIDLDGTIIVVVRLQDQFYAFQEFCTHRYGPLSEGDFHDHQVQCPWHRSGFDVRNGKVTQGPAKINLKTFEVAVRNGVLAVRGKSDDFERSPAALPEPRQEFRHK